MATDHTAARMAPLDAEVRRVLENWGAWRSNVLPTRDDVRQCMASLAAVEAERDLWKERNDIQADKVIAAEQRATRLAALVERLRDLAHFSSDAYSHQYAEYIDAEMAASTEVDRTDAS